jgi:hypothetical protein
MCFRKDFAAAYTCSVAAHFFRSLNTHLFRLVVCARLYCGGKTKTKLISVLFKFLPLATRAAALF